MDRALNSKGDRRTYLPDEIRLNQRIRGVQGADWVHRMLPYWNRFLNEAHQLSTDPRILQYIDGKVIHDALEKVSKGVSPEHATDPDYKILMRALIVYRFIKNMS